MRQVFFLVQWAMCQISTTPPFQDFYATGWECFTGPDEANDTALYHLGRGCVVSMSRVPLEVPRG